jgi:general secretion pathway protein M
MIPRLQHMLSRFPVAAAAIYVAVVVIFAFTALVELLDLVDRHDAVATAADVLAQLEGHGPPRARADQASDVTVPTGSPFVEGTTVSVAGAALLQRVAAAASKVSGNILSSQVDLEGSQSKAGFVNVTASLEVDAASLQPLLYDLEAGMPFVFIEQLDVLAPTSTAGGSTAAGKVKVQMSVSGQWQGQK